jgi:hypothetical protein
MFNPTAETLALTRQALSKGLTREEALKKGVSVSTGLVYYDLQAPAKNLYPVITPLRNSIPRVGRPVGYGDSAKWKQITSITGSGYDAMGWVPEGQRSGTMSYTSTQKAAAYMTIGEEDYATYEAIQAAIGFENIESTDSLRTLQKMMLKEEIAILGGNGGGVQLGTPGQPSLSAAGSGATLPSLSPYSVIVVALTLEGYLNSSLGNGVATTKTITGADGSNFVLNGGSSNKSTNQTQNVSLGQTLSATVTPIQGAVAYAWFVGAVGSETLQAITTINSATFSAPLTGGQQPATAITQDNSSNSGLAFDGLLTQAFNTQNLAYVATQATGTAGTGTPLTSSGRGSVNEIDTMLQSMWNTYQISPTVLYVNAQELKNITSKVLGTGTSSLLRYETGADNGIISAMASGTIEYYFNPFGGSGAEKGRTGGVKMPILVHPKVPPGTVLAYAEQLPTWYQNNEVPNVAEVITREDYHRIDWPPRTRKREYGVYAQEVLAVYATFGLGVITNIGNG